MARRRTCAVAVTRGLLRCGVVAGPLFVTVFAVEGARRADYSAKCHPVSALALGPAGWVQTANFAAAGALTVAGAVGLSRAGDGGAGGRLGPVLIGAAGVGLLASGAFPTDPVNDYPPGTADLAVAATSAGVWHNVASVPVLVGLSVAALASARQVRRGGAHLWCLYSAASGASAVVNGAVASAGFGGAQAFAGRAGLHQRAAIGALLGWTTAVFVRALRRAG